MEIAALLNCRITFLESNVGLYSKRMNGRGYKYADQCFLSPDPWKHKWLCQDQAGKNLDFEISTDAAHRAIELYFQLPSHLQSVTVSDTSTKHPTLSIAVFCSSQDVVAPSYGYKNHWHQLLVPPHRHVESLQAELTSATNPSPSTLLRLSSSPRILSGGLHLLCYSLLLRCRLGEQAWRGSSRDLEI